MSDIPERDWKVFRRLSDAAGAQFCERALDDVKRAASAPGVNAYDRFGVVGRLLDERARDFGRAFGDMRRSTALLQILAIRRLGLLDDDALSQFSEGTQEHVRRGEEALRPRE